MGLKGLNLYPLYHQYIPIHTLLLMIKDPGVKIRTAEGTKYKPLSSPPILVTQHLHLPESNFHIKVGQSPRERKSQISVNIWIETAETIGF